MTTSPPRSQAPASRPPPKVRVRVGVRVRVRVIVRARVRVRVGVRVRVRVRRAHLPWDRVSRCADRGCELGKYHGLGRDGDALLR